jgi:hypothetical protein
MAGAAHVPAGVAPDCLAPASSTTFSQFGVISGGVPAGLLEEMAKVW